MDASTSAALVKRCQAGQVDALEPLGRHYQNAAYAVAFRYVKERTIAEDIVRLRPDAHCLLVRSALFFPAW
jgi:hypothetical protein